MAYLPNNRTQDEEEPGKPVLSGPSGDIQAGMAPPTTAPAEGTPTSTGFTDIRKYLAENANQAEGMGTAIAGDVNQAAEDVEKDIDTGKSTFEKTQKDYYGPNETFVNESLSDPEKADLARFTAMRTGTYGGPESMRAASDIYTPLDTAAKAAYENKGKLTEDAAGLGTLTEGWSSDPSRGKGSLNAALMMGDPGSQTALSAARDRTKALTDYLGNADTGTASFVGGLKDEMEAFAPKVEAAGTASADAFKAAIDQAFATNNAAALKQVNDIINAANSSTSAAQSKAGNAMFDSGHRSFVPTVNGNVINRSMSATAEEYARDAALDRLLGRESGVLVNDEAGEAGKWGGAATLFANDPARLANSIIYGSDGYAAPISSMTGKFSVTPDGKLMQYGVVVGDLKEGTTGTDPWRWGVRDSRDLAGAPGAPW